LLTIAGYLAIALDNAQLYTSPSKKRQIERLKDFSKHRRIAQRGCAGIDLHGAMSLEHAD